MTDATVINAEEVQDVRTGEIVPIGSPAQVIVGQLDINKVGTLELTDQANKVLEEPLDPEDVKIRPDGLVYLPWTWYNKRLNRAFGKLGWGLIPQGAPKIQNMGNSTLIVWLNWLVIKGIPVSMAGGEMSYQPSNFTMSHGDAIEGARSNSLARNCKNLGMALELWDMDWVNAWKKRFAIQIDNEKGNKKIWVKKSGHTVNPDQNSAVAAAVEEGGVVASITPDTEPEVKETAYRVSDLRTVPNVRKIVAMRKVENPEVKDSDVIKSIGELDKNKKYTISQDGQFVEYTGV